MTRSDRSGEGISGPIRYVYTYASHEDESELCELELSTLFGCAVTGKNGIVACRDEQPLDADRSPFIKRRIDVMHQADELPQLMERLRGMDTAGDTFKVLYTEGDEPHAYEARRAMERQIGASIGGVADMRQPQRLYGLMRYGGQWLFGPCRDSEAVWLRHQRKPCNYSTALPVRAARAIVNIAAGRLTEGKRLIDPCCGMGSVLIEALSMGVTIEGMDKNPLAVRGARENLTHFGYPDVVRLGDMTERDGRYDAAIVDLPYNLCSVLTDEAQLSMLRAVRRMSDRAVIVATADIGMQLEAAGMHVASGILLRKGSFARHVSVVK
ncbi:RsmD family RNA methyltransferase [Paenibacillus sp. J5C_2022]|uniref:TRM11 family SAM-dependent methyltransferase n=1 Tax=Paenibacillus sp. J5C2022 TaxID=2977129 RepID=UPI0021CF2196|nr:RsmD family RNA methyltransferase [Paenibacillus sp. J5C2022]MCU6711805.1 RsmD family RNA methyltransferase [Paenibacillus sp. J5C2022]